MRRSFPLLGIALLSTSVISSSASAQPQPSVTSSAFLLPVAVHPPGLFGSFFKTHLAFYNATDSTFTLTATLYDSNGTPHVASFALEPNQSMAFADFVDEVFHLTGAGTVKFETGNPAYKIALSAQVYTNGPCGDFGTDVPPIAVALSAAESISPGVSNNDSQRANLACFNGSAAPNTVTADVFDERNFKVETITFSLPGNAWLQKAVSRTVDGGYVRFRPSAPAACYAVDVTNSSNDGRFIPAQTWQ
jgi:hypothetical protein